MWQKIGTIFPDVTDVYGVNNFALSLQNHLICRPFREWPGGAYWPGIEHMPGVIGNCAVAVSAADWKVAVPKIGRSGKPVWTSSYPVITEGKRIVPFALNPDDQAALLAMIRLHRRAG